MEKDREDGIVRSDTDSQADDNSRDDIWNIGQITATNLKLPNTFQGSTSEDNVSETTQTQGCKHGDRACADKDMSSAKTNEVQTSSKEQLAEGNLENGVRHQKETSVCITDKIPASMLKNPQNAKNIKFNFAELQHLKSVVAKLQKPPYSYASLIVFAIEMSKNKSLTISEIRAQLPKMFPFFRTSNPTWKESVRNALVKGKYFYRVESAGSKMSLWMVDDKHVIPDIFRRQKQYPYSELYADTLQQELSIRRTNRISEQPDSTTVSSTAKTRSDFGVFNLHDAENRTPSSEPSKPLLTTRTDTDIAIHNKFTCQGKRSETASLRTNETDDFLGARETKDDASRKEHKTKSECRFIDNDLQNNQLPQCLINDNGTRAQKRTTVEETPDAKRQKIASSPKVTQVSEWFRLGAVDASNKVSNPTRSDPPNYYSSFATMFQRQQTPETVNFDGDMYMRYPVPLDFSQFGCPSNLASYGFNNIYQLQYRYPAADMSSPYPSMTSMSSSYPAAASMPSGYPTVGTSSPFPALASTSSPFPAAASTSSPYPAVANTSSGFPAAASTSSSYPVVANVSSGFPAAGRSSPFPAVGSTLNRYPTVNTPSHGFNNASRYDYLAGALNYGPRDAFMSDFPYNAPSYDSQFSYPYQYAGYNTPVPAMGQSIWSGYTESPTRYSHGSSDVLTLESWSDRESWYQNPNELLSPEANTDSSSGTP